MSELILEVSQEADGGFVAECLTKGIFTQADTWEELRSQVQEAVEAYCFNTETPQAVRLHLVRDTIETA